MDKISYHTSAALASPSVLSEHNVPYRPRPKSSNIRAGSALLHPDGLDGRAAVYRFQDSNHTRVHGEPQQVWNAKRSIDFDVRQEQQQRYVPQAQRRQQLYEERKVEGEGQRRDEIERRQILERERCVHEELLKGERQRRYDVERQQIAERQQKRKTKAQQRQLDAETQRNETEMTRLEFPQAVTGLNENHTLEILKRVQAFIAEIHRLETWVLEYRYALHKKKNPEFGDSKYRLAEKILREILEDEDLWHVDLLEPDEMILAVGIMRGLSELDLLHYWDDFTPWGDLYDKSSMQNIVVLVQELADTMELLSPLTQESLTPESCPTVAGEPDIPTPQDGSRSLDECDIPGDRSTLQKSSSESWTLERGREPEARTAKVRARSEPPKRPCSWLPQVSTCAPQANSRPSKVSKRSRSSAGNNRGLQRLHSTTRPQALNSRDEHSSESGSEQEDNRLPPPAPDPSSAQSPEISRRFLCLNTIGEPEAFRNCKHSFEHISQLARHMRTHSFFVCHKCIIAFEGEQELVAHERLPHSRCKSRGCRRYRACACEADLQNFSNFHCGACICSSEKKFDALLLLRYPHHGQQPSNTTPNFNTGDQSGSNEDVAMNGPHLEYNDPFSEFYIDSMDTDIQQIEWQGLDSTAVSQDSSSMTASNQVESTTSTSNDITSDPSDHRDANEERLHQLTEEISVLKGKVDKLEEHLNHPATPALEHVLGMVWRELVLSGSPETWTNAALYNLVQSIAPNVIVSSEAYAQSPPHDSVLSCAARAAPSFTNVTSGPETCKQKEQPSGLSPEVGPAGGRPMLYMFGG